MSLDPKARQVLKAHKDLLELLARLAHKVQPVLLDLQAHREQLVPMVLLE